MWIRLLTSLNVFIIKITKGHLGNNLGKQSVLVLHTVGRKSGKQHLTTLSYYRDGDNYLVVGSNWGKESHPGWYFNLIQQPKTTIQVGSKIVEVEAHPTAGENYQRLWELVTHKNGQYIIYQSRMKRHIPIVVLTPISPV